MKGIPLLLLALNALCQTAPPPSSSSSSGSSSGAMRQSIDRQRASVRKQLESSVPQGTGSSWFTTPWPTSTIEPVAMLPSPLSLPQSSPEAPPVTASQAEATCDPIAPEMVTPLIREASSREKVKEELLRAVIQQESGFRPCAVSPKGAKGLMQLMPATASDLGVKDPFNPKENIDAGAKMLSGLLAKYNGDVKLALSAYNAGAGAVDRAGGVPNIDETKSYLTSILQKLFY